MRQFVTYYGNTNQRRVFLRFSQGRNKQMAGVTTKTLRADRGWTRYVSIDGEIWGTITFRFLSGTNGAAFSRSLRGGLATIEVHVFSVPLGGKTTDGTCHEVEIFADRTRARVRTDGDKWARARVAELNLVELIVWRVSGKG